jgi:type II secretory pathway component PulJ
MTKRRGYAIIEMLLVMSAMAILLGLCVGLIHGLLRLDRISRGHLAEATTRDRLARQLRQDVRGAASSKPAGKTNDPSDRLELSRSDGRIVLYQMREGHLERTERDGDRVVRGERFSLPSRAAPQFRVREQGGSVFIVATFPRKSIAKPGETAREFQVEARLGKDRRFAGLGEATR